MKKKEKKRNGIPARIRRGILAACMVFFFSLQIFQGKMLWRESTGESPGKVLSGKVPAEENERTQIMETTQQKEPVSDAQTAQEKETREQEREQLLARLYARSAALVDADSGRVLLGKEEHVMRPMAKYNEDHDLHSCAGKGKSEGPGDSLCKCGRTAEGSSGNARRGSVLSGGSSIFPDAGIP